MSAIVDKFGLTAEVVLIAAFFLTLFASMANPALTNVAYGIMAVAGVVSMTMVADALRA